MRSLARRQAEQRATRTTRHDGGPEEGSRGIVADHPSTTRHDGGPEEGSRGIVADHPSTTRFDGGPNEGTRGAGHSPRRV